MLLHQRLRRWTPHLWTLLLLFTHLQDEYSTVTRHTLCFSYRVSIYILLFVAWSVCVAGGGSYFVRVLSHVSHLRLFHSLLIIILLLPPLCALRNLLRTFCSRFHVACYCNYLRYFHSMTVSCPSGLCLSASLELVTSQARLESDVLDPQPGVTAGHCRLFQALGGPDRYPAVPSVSR